MRKSSKRLIISTEAVNSFGFRVLTSGIDLSQYRNNPILLWMHQRPTGASRDEVLPLGFMSDLLVEGSVLSGVPNFDDTDPFAIQIYNKVENGTLKMCSAGLKPLEQSDAPALMLPGQNLPTLIRSLLVEVSIADIGSNPDALAVELYDNAGCIVKLSAANAKAVIGSLTGNETPRAKLTAEHSPATLAIVDNAVKAGKFTKSEAENLLATGSSDIQVAAILKKVKEAKINPDRLKGSIPDVILKLVAKSWRELQSAWGDETKKLAQYAPEVYKAKFFEQNGRLPAVMPKNL